MDAQANPFLDASLDHCGSRSPQQCAHTDICYNLGIVNILVGFAPLKPAEFVVISIQQIAGDLQ